MLTSEYKHKRHIFYWNYNTNVELATMYVEIVLYIYLIPNLICVPACMCLFVCLLGFNVAFKHLRSCIAMMPACSSGSLSLTNELPHRTGHDNPSRHSIGLRQRAYFSCNPLMWNVTLEYTTIHFNVLGQTRLGYPSPTFHT